MTWPPAYLSGVDLGDEQPASLHAAQGISTGDLARVRQYLEENPPAISIRQLQGFTQFTAKTDVVNDSGSRFADTYGDLDHGTPTLGPSLTGLPDGQYLLMFGALLTPPRTEYGMQAFMALEIDAVAASDDPVLRVESSISQDAAQIAHDEKDGLVTTASATFVQKDGPIVTVRNGSYLFTYGAEISPDAATSAAIGLQIDGSNVESSRAGWTNFAGVAPVVGNTISRQTWKHFTGAEDELHVVEMVYRTSSSAAFTYRWLDAVETSPVPVAVSRATLMTMRSLPLGGHTVTCKYRMSAPVLDGSPVEPMLAKDRWLIALRYNNA